MRIGNLACVFQRKLQLTPTGKCLQQSESTLTDCDAALREMAFSQREFRESHNGQLLLAARYSRMPFSEVKAATDGGEPIILQGLQLAGIYDAVYFEDWNKAVVRRLDVEQLLRHDTSVILGGANETILRAWRECKAEEGGLTMYISAQNDNLAAVRIEWVPFPMAPLCNPHVQEFIIQPVEGVRAVGGQHFVVPGAQLGIRAARTVIFERPAGSHLLVSLKTCEFGGLQKAYLPSKYQHQ